MPPITPSELQRLVKHYEENHQKEYRRYLRLFRSEVSNTNAIRCAAKARVAGEPKHPHQQRLPNDALAEAAEELVAAEGQLMQAPSFAALLRIVCDKTEDVSMFGELARYDTALRIGSRLRKRPVEVYLHAGTRRGCAALGLDVSNATLRVSKFPTQLRHLPADEIENFTCIYKDQFLTPTQAPTKKKRHHG